MNCSDGACVQSSLIWEERIPKNWPNLPLIFNFAVTFCQWATAKREVWTMCTVQCTVMPQQFHIRAGYLFKHIPKICWTWTHSKQNLYLLWMSEASQWKQCSFVSEIKFKIHMKSIYIMIYTLIFLEINMNCSWNITECRQSRTRFIILSLLKLLLTRGFFSFFFLHISIFFTRYFWGSICFPHFRHAQDVMRRLL